MIVAVINDNTGEIHAVVEGYEHRFPLPSRPIMIAQKITEFEIHSKHSAINIEYHGLTHQVDSRNYSTVCEVSNE